MFEIPFNFLDTAVHSYNGFPYTLERTTYKIIWMQNFEDIWDQFFPFLTTHPIYLT